ncbi:MAG: hypothetical protein ACO3UU_00215 [Minisyncoccia bacterium]
MSSFVDSTRLRIVISIVTTYRKDLLQWSIMIARNQTTTNRQTPPKKPTLTDILQELNTTPYDLSDIELCQIKSILSDL